jgi:DNA-binding NarL/FixJ family response regulator
LTLIVPGPRRRHADGSRTNIAPRRSEIPSLPSRDFQSDPRRARTAAKPHSGKGLRRDGTNGANIRVLVVDDQDLFRAGLRALLESEGVQVVAETGSGDKALELAVRVVPDVVLLTLNMTEARGAEALRRMHEAAPDVKIIALTDTPDPGEVIDALTAGACGYLAKDESGETIAAGIVRAAAAGEPLLSARTTEALIDRLRALSNQRIRADVLRAKLSPREIEVLALIAEGQDNGEIARLLFISPHTVKHHVRTICEKLGVQKRVEAAVWAARAGLV